jgi:2-oxoglutarate dehydrogenase E1 component
MDTGNGGTFSHKPIPVRTRRKYFPTLDLENYGLSDTNLETSYHAGREIGLGKARLADIVQQLKHTYCGHIGSEFMFIRNPQKTAWLTERIEKNSNRTQFSPEEKKRIWLHLRDAVGFEKFIHNRFRGAKAVFTGRSRNIDPRPE